MADNVDPLKKSVDTPSEGFYPQAGQTQADTGGNYYRPAYNSVWTRQSSTDVNNQMYFPGEQQPQSTSNKMSSFFNSFKRSESRPSDSFDYSTQDPPPPPNVSSQLPQRLASDSADGQIQYREQSYEACTENQPESYRGEDYSLEEEYYNYQKPHKKKSLSSKIDRFVQRIPMLGKIYKQPPTSPDRSGSAQQFQYNQSTVPVDGNQFERELTADELALNQRYTDKTRMKLIDLQASDQTQPVDLCLHHETNKIYSCDIGRSIVEIYDINGTPLHVINDATITKFQPTAIAIAFDETVIIASHFNHCLHMYSPIDSQNISNPYLYKQFKLGSPGDQLHQFYHPAGIAIDHKDGNLYVCDRGNYRIQVIRPEGICVRVIELVLNGKKKYPLDTIRVTLQSNLDQIVCIVGNGDAICFLPKQAEGRIVVDPLYIVDENGLGLEGASGLAVDAHDRIFISDTGHHRIVVCTPEGGYITSFGTEGDGLDQLKRPCGLDVTRDGTVVVADPGNKRLHLFGIIQEQTLVDNNPFPEIPADTEHDLVANL